MRLNQITIPVTDLNKSIRFYENIGLKLIVHTHDRYARFECPIDNATLSLHLVDNISTNHRTIVYFELDNLDQYVEGLVNKGIKMDTMPKDQAWLWREAQLKDPDNNPIILYYAGENRRYPPWRKED